MPRQACLSGSIKQQASPDGESCYPVQGPARRGRRGMHSPQGEHNPLVAAGQKNSFLSACGRCCYPVQGPARRGRRGMRSPQGEHNPRYAPPSLLEREHKTTSLSGWREAAILCKGPPGKGIGDVGAERRNPFWAPPGEGVGECTARRASTIPSYAPPSLLEREHKTTSLSRWRELQSCARARPARA